MNIVNIELRLDAGGVGAGGAEHFQRPAELVRFRLVFRIIDDNKVAFGVFERIVECFWFCPGGCIGDNDYIEIAGKIERFRDLDRLVVDAFQYDFNIEFGGRVAPALGSKRRKAI